MGSSTGRVMGYFESAAKYPAANSDYPLENVPEAPNNTSGGSTKKAA